MREETLLAVSNIILAIETGRYGTNTPHRERSRCMCMDESDSCISLHMCVTETVSGLIVRSPGRCPGMLLFEGLNVCVEPADNEDS